MLMRMYESRPDATVNWGSICQAVKKTCFATTALTALFL